WPALFREKGVENFRFRSFDGGGLEPGSKKRVKKKKKKEEFLSTWTAVVEVLRRHTSESENREQIQILFHCCLGTEAIDHVLKARAGQAYWKGKHWMLEALI
ncbi:unnamed protein product, partial [Symbiodinium sp. CCMP2456]